MQYVTVLFAQYLRNFNYKPLFWGEKTFAVMLVQRLLEVIEYSGLSQSAFAKKVGSTQANLWRQLNGQKVNVATVVAVAQQFPEIDCNWLLRGEGSMVKGLMDDAQERRIDGLLDVVTTLQNTINNLQEKIKQLQNQ